MAEKKLPIELDSHCSICILQLNGCKLKWTTSITWEELTFFCKNKNVQFAEWRLQIIEIAQEWKWDYKG